MRPLFTPEQLASAAYNDMLAFQCEVCLTTFYDEAKWIKTYEKHSRDKNKYCSQKCMGIAKITAVDVVCARCQKPFQIKPSQKKRSKTGNSFCSQSCAGTYNNTHKATGSRRSKLEIWLEKQINILYSNLSVKYNEKDAINSELDIYIPSLNLAFELNGIFHYEPIYGTDKLASTQNNDGRKFQACLERKIELVIIDTSGQKYFKEKTSQKYLEIIKQIINQKIGSRDRT